MNKIINIGICLTDVKAKVYRHENGKTYLNLNVAERQSVGKYGETHSVYYFDKTTRQKTYCGSGKTIIFDNGEQQTQSNQSTTEDTPF